MTPLPDPVPSVALPGLTWIPLMDDGHEEPSWMASLGTAVAQDVDGLAALVGDAWNAPGLRFEAWHAFTLGMDGFVPLIVPSQWADALARTPIDTDTGLPHGVAVNPALVRAPHVGPQGLEGCIIHPASGHILRAIVGGIPPHISLPVLVALTAQPTAKNDAEVGA